MPTDRLIVTWFGLGDFKFAPGTIGSFGALPLCLLVFHLNWVLFVIVMLPVLIVGWRAVSRYVADMSNGTDPQEVVFDEVIGQTLSVWCVKSILTTNNHFGTVFIVCFVIFRFFDILKLFPINYIEKNLSGATGIMLDDIVATIMTVPCAAVVLKLIQVSL